MEEENNPLIILEQLNNAYDGCFSSDSAFARQSEKALFKHREKLAKAGIAIKQNDTSGRWEIIQKENRNGDNITH